MRTDKISLQRKLKCLQNKFERTEDDYVLCEEISKIYLLLNDTNMSVEYYKKYIQIAPKDLMDIVIPETEKNALLTFF